MATHKYISWHNLVLAFVVVWFSFPVKADSQGSLRLPDNQEPSVEYSWLEAYQNFLRAQVEEISGEFQTAIDRYREAEILFAQLQAQFPSWSPDWIVQRLNQCREKIKTLEHMDGKSAIPFDREAQLGLLIKEVGKLVWALAETNFLLTDYHQLKLTHQALIETNQSLTLMLAQLKDKNRRLTASSMIDSGHDSSTNSVLIKLNNALSEERRQQENLRQHIVGMERQLLELKEKLKVISLEKEESQRELGTQHQDQEEMGKTISKYQKLLTELTDKNALLGQDNAQKALLIEELKDYINWQNTMLNDFQAEPQATLLQKISLQEGEIQRLKLEVQRHEQRQINKQNEIVMKHLDWDKIQMMNQRLRNQIDELIIRLQQAQNNERIAHQESVTRQNEIDQLKQHRDELERKWNAQLLVNQQLIHTLTNSFPATANQPKP